jgi:hypothetical protein
MSSVSRWFLLAAEYRESIRIGEEALAMADQLGLDAIKANALITLGSARELLFEDRGLEELSQGVEVARAANLPFEAVRGLGNLASRLWVLGDLARSLPLWREAQAEAEQHGQGWFGRWFRGVSVPAEYELGYWDVALERAEAFIAEVESGSPHYLAGESYFTRSLIRLGRADDDGALYDAEHALAVTERARDPQARFPATAAAAHVYMELGDPGRARPPAEEFLAAVVSGGGLGFATSTLHILSWSVAAIGRGPELADAVTWFGDNPWARAAAAFALGDPVAAAETLRGIGAVSSEAFCRLEAARAGHLAQLEPALAFYRSVGAERYVRECESLLATPA